ncbi:MAG: ATP-binding protein [Armatimonadota bacterium]|nr:ATP-binding protein [Armatimonadota bacterium]
MTKKIKWRFVLTYLVVTFLAIFSLGLTLSYFVERQFIAEVEAALHGHGTLVKDVLEPKIRQSKSTDRANLDRVCERLAADIRASVTVYDNQGRVIGSSGTGFHAPGVEDLANSIKGLQEGFGCRICHSEAREVKGAVVVVPLKANGKPAGKVVLQASLYEARRAAGRMHRIILVTLAITSAVAVAISMRLASSIADPISKMNEMARTMAAGDLSQRVPVMSKDEIGELAASLNLMADRLCENIEQVAEQKKRMETILRTMADGIVVTDKRGRIILFNPASERILGIKSEKVVGEQIEALSMIPDAVEMIHGTVKSRRTLRKELKIHAPVERIVNAYSAPVSDEGGQIIGVVLGLHDVTEIRMLAEVRKDFVANVSHELRTPVAAIRAIVGALQSGAKEDPEVLERFVNSLDSETERLSLLLADLLNISELESGKRKPQRSNVLVRELVEQAVENLSEKALQYEVSVKINVPHEMQMYVDKRQMHQVLINLIDNAIKYTPEKGSVEISASETNEDWILSVSDTGVGIPPAHIDRIFERFYRVDKARSRQLGGTGLGLSIVQDIVQAHGGRISVESTVGVGSTFTIAIPKMEPENLA